mmetsp:Transcript_44132/g.73550  ORF Transcript_44132/g.73550 Transcript_44132/m.73550 type:complete len:155 (-) Transcript_44132:413-877(-)
MSNPVPSAKQRIPQPSSPSSSPSSSSSSSSCSSLPSSPPPHLHSSSSTQKSISKGINPSTTVSNSLSRSPPSHPPPYPELSQPLPLPKDGKNNSADASQVTIRGLHELYERDASGTNSHIGCLSTTADSTYDNEAREETKKEANDKNGNELREE